MRVSADELQSLGAKPVQGSGEGVRTIDSDNTYWYMPPSEDDLDGGDASVLYLSRGVADAVELGDFKIPSSYDAFNKNSRYVKSLNALYIVAEDSEFVYSRVATKSVLIGPDSIIAAAPGDYAGIGVPEQWKADGAMFIVLLENGNTNMLLVRKGSGGYRRALAFPTDFVTVHNVGRSNEKTSLLNYSRADALVAGESPNMKLFSLGSGKRMDIKNVISILSSHPMNKNFFGVVTMDDRSEIYTMPEMNPWWAMKSPIESLNFNYEEFPSIGVLMSAKSKQGLIDIMSKEVLCKARYTLSLSEPPTLDCIYLYHTAEDRKVTMALYDLKARLMAVPEGTYELVVREPATAKFACFKEKAFSGRAKNGAWLHMPDAIYDTMTRTFIEGKGNLEAWAAKKQGG